MIEMSGPLIEKLRYYGEACVRLKITLHIVGKAADTKEVRILRDEVRESVLARTLLSERNADGQIPLNPYDKWRGAHWVLALLADLGYPPGDRDLLPLREQV